MATNKPLIVILGLGEMGLIHAKNLSKERRILLGLASSRKEVLSSTAAKLGADRVYSCHEDVFNDAEVTGVVIATPPPSHPDVIMKAAAAKKHIFSEKPLGYDSESIAKAIEAVEKSGVRFMSGFNRRWDPDYITARRTVDAGSLGDPVVLKCTSGDPEYPEKYHRGAAKFSMLKDLAVHDIDLARWLTRSEVKSAFAVCDAMTYPTLREMGDADVTVAVLEMTCGAKVIIHLSRAFHFGYDVTTELFCKEGAMQIGELKKTSVSTIKDKTRGTDVVWHFADRFEAAFAREMEAFAQLVLVKNDDEASALVGNNSSFATSQDGLAATIVAETLVKSSQSGVPELVPHNS